MNPFPEFHIPPAEAAILDRLIHAGAALQGEEAIQLQKDARDLSETISTASMKLDKIEKRYAELKQARDNAIKELHEYHSGAEGTGGDDPGEEPGAGVGAGEVSVRDTYRGVDADSGPGTVIGSASDVSDEEVAAAQAEEAREAEGHGDAGSMTETEPDTPEGGPDPVLAVG